MPMFAGLTTWKASYSNIASTSPFITIYFVVMVTVLTLTIPMLFTKYKKKSLVSDFMISSSLPVDATSSL